MAHSVLDDIRLFLEVAKSGSFKLAAVTAGVPQATLSRRIAELEKRSGLRLLNRTTRRLSLTAEGEAYVERCRHLIDEVMSAHEEIAQAGHKASGTLRLSSTPDFAAFYLPTVLKSYLAACPSVNVELSLTSRIEDLAAGNLDAAIRMGPLLDSGLIARALGHLQPVLCATPAFLKNNRPIRTPNDLQSVECIRLNSLPSSGIWELQHPREGTERIQVNGRVIAGGPQVACQLCLQDNGVALLDPLMASSHLMRRELQAVLPEWRSKGVQLSLVMPSRLMPVRVRILLEHLNTFLANGEWFYTEAATMSAARATSWLED